MLTVHVDDVVEMRKPHPCGGKEWVVTRVGADIRLRCLTCGRRIILARSKLEKRAKRVTPKQSPAHAPARRRSR